MPRSKRKVGRGFPRGNEGRVIRKGPQWKAGVRPPQFLCDPEPVPCNPIWTQFPYLRKGFVFLSFVIPKAPSESNYSTGKKTEWGREMASRLFPSFPSPTFRSTTSKGLKMSPPPFSPRMRTLPAPGFSDPQAGPYAGLKGHPPTSAGGATAQQWRRSYQGASR